MMVQSYNLQINPQRMKDYSEKDLVYKDQARQIICNGLGYEPPLQISALSELNLRSALKSHTLGETSKDSLEEYIEFQIRFINKIMIEKTPAFHC